MDCCLPGSSVQGIFPDKNAGAGCDLLLQGIFSQGLNLGLLHCRWIFSLLSHQGKEQIVLFSDKHYSRVSLQKLLLTPPQYYNLSSNKNQFCIQCSKKKKDLQIIKRALQKILLEHKRVIVKFILSQ